AAFLHIRKMLIDQLGSEPGEELRHAQRHVLRTTTGPEQRQSRTSILANHLENRWRLIGSPSFG
ncbi:hypothetical protein ACFFQW_45895, partial [Umezawaea endophytica]